MADREKTKMEHDEDEYNFNMKKKARMREGPVLRLRSSTAISQAPPSPSFSNSRQNHAPAVVAGVSAMDLNASGSGRITRNASQHHQEERANAKSASSQGTGHRKDEPFYQIFSSEKAFFDMQEVIKQVRGVLIMNPETIRKLLIQFNWDHDRLVEAYFEDREKIFQDTNIPPLAVSSGLYDPLDKSTRKVCPICFDEMPGEQMASMYCGHTYCTNCWQRYIEVNIELCLDQDIVCPHPRCPIILEEPGIRRSLGESRKMERYYRLMAQSFVECHPNYRWCYPVVTEKNCCNRAVRIDVLKWDKIECSCGRISCSDCSEDWHYPIKCNLLTTWRNKCIITLKNNPGWIIDLISLCRFCKAPNEKSFGNYVKCQKRNCDEKYWVFWDHPSNEDTGHENESEPEEYACYHPKSGTPAFQHTMRKKFYFYRFNQHEDSLRREKDFIFKAYQMADEMCKSGNWSASQASVIYTAAQLLAQNRPIVMYSYVLAYYAIKTDNLDVFVEYQGLLEEAVEKMSYTISRFLRRTVTELNLKWLKGLATRSETIVEFRTSLMDLVNKGYRNCTWKFNKE